MASSFLLSFTPNPTINNSYTFIAEPCCLRQQQPQLKQTNITSTTLSSSRTLHQSGTVETSGRGTCKSMETRLATAWREIQGLNNWENLIEPLDPLLRHEIVRYGELVSACYKAFDLDPASNRYLNCKYGKKAMMRQVGLKDSGYDVTKYIYATAPEITIPGAGENPNPAKWIGYVAASADKAVSRLGRRDIVIAFRGTVTYPEWMANLMSSLTSARLDPHDPRPEVKVEAGFLSLYTSDERGNRFGLGSCREQLLSEVSRLLDKHRGEEISITIAGHSMGSSLALLLAYDIAELGLHRRPNGGSEKEIPLTVVSFGGPRVGNSSFKERCEELGIKVLRVVNVNDPITKLPGVLFNENFVKGYEFPWRCSCYAHVGVELMLDFFKMHNPSCVHDLEDYIGLLKCPKSSNNNHDHDHGRNKLMEKAKGFLSGGVERFDALRWRNTAIDVLNLVQSQWI